MVPTTQAVRESLRVEPSDDSAPSTSSQHGGTEARGSHELAPTSTTAVLKRNRLHFLDLPAELRILVYDFASEKLDDLEFAPRTIRRHSLGSARHMQTGGTAWKYLGLTQTCRSIRAGYRPLWLRNLSIRGSHTLVEKFSRTFLLGPQGLRNIPKRVQIDFDFPLDSLLGTTHDLTHILQMRARSPDTSLKYVPFALAQGIGPKLCLVCPTLWCQCVPNYQNWVSYQRNGMSQTNVLHNLIHNNNRAWLNLFRGEHVEEKVAVECTFTGIPGHMLVTICLRTRFWRERGLTADTKAALDVVQALGLFDLPDLQKIDFEIIFRVATMYKSGSRNIVSSETRVVRIS